jgi:hypothetical protein
MATASARAVGHRPAAFAKGRLPAARPSQESPVNPMSERTRRELVTFLHPFSLAGVEGQQAPGTYTVETIEEPIEGLSFVAYRRLSTTIVLPSPQYGAASRQAVAIDPLDLEAARKRDAELTSEPR